MSIFEMDAARENREADSNRIVDITPFIHGLRDADRKSELAEAVCKEKIKAMRKASALLNKLVKRAKANGRPHHLITKALRAQLGIVRELDAVRGNV